MTLATASILWWVASVPPATLPCACGPELAAVAWSEAPGGDVTRSLGLRAGEPVTWTKLSRALSTRVRALARAGYLDAQARVRAAETDSLRLRLQIHRGLRWKWGNVDVEGRPVVPLTKIGEPLGRLRGRDCTLAALEDAIGAVLEVYAQNGYPFARVDIDSLDGTAGRLNAALIASEGPMVTWGALRLLGAEKTKNSTARRIIGFEPGERFDARIIQEARARMTSSGLFSWVGEPVLRAGETPDIVDLEIQVSETRTSSAVGAVGYVPATGSRDGYFVGRAELALENMAGTGRSASLAWRRAAPGATTMSVGYREPWFLGTPFSIRVRLMQDVYDTTYTKRRGELAVGMVVGSRMEASVGMAGERIQAASQAEELFPTYVKYEGAVRVKWEGRDTRVLAERGWFADLQVSYGHRQSQVDSVDERIPEAVADCIAELYVPVWQQLVVAFTAGAKVLVSDADQLPSPLQFPLGGARDLRGYREEQFRGAQVLWLNVNPWPLRWSHGALGPFVDVGYYHLAQSQGGSGGHSKLGYGVALRNLTRLGVLSLDYGVGEDSDPLDGRIHVSLQALF